MQRYLYSRVCICWFVLVMAPDDLLCSVYPTQQVRHRIIALEFDVLKDGPRLQQVHLLTAHFETNHPIYLHRRDGKLKRKKKYIWGKRRGKLFKSDLIHYSSYLNKFDFSLFILPRSPHIFHIDACMKFRISFFFFKYFSQILFHVYSRRFMDTFFIYMLQSISASWLTRRFGIRISNRRSSFAIIFYNQSANVGEMKSAKYLKF